MFRQSLPRISAISALGALSAATIGFSFALADPTEAAPLPHQEVVWVGDLDLADANGQRTFDRRIRRASRKVCAEHRNLGPVPGAHYWGCVSRAVAGAEAQRQQLEPRAQLSSPQIGQRSRPPHRKR